MITPCAPTASAVRRSVPKFCGSCSESSTSSSGGSPRSVGVPQDVVDRRRRRGRRWPRPLPGGGPYRTGGPAPPAADAARRRPARAGLGHASPRARRGWHALRQQQPAQRRGPARSASRTDLRPQITSSSSTCCLPDGPRRRRPSSASSSRILSASAHCLALRRSGAPARSNSMNGCAATCFVARLFGQREAEHARQVAQGVLGLGAAPRAPTFCSRARLMSRARSKSAAAAAGVLKSSSIAALKDVRAGRASAAGAQRPGVPPRRPRRRATAATLAAARSRATPRCRRFQALVAVGQRAAVVRRRARTGAARRRRAGRRLRGW